MEPGIVAMSIIMDTLRRGPVNRIRFCMQANQFPQGDMIACFMLSIGIAPQVVMKFTGHADYKSMKPYIAIATRTKSDAMAKIAASWEEVE